MPAPTMQLREAPPGYPIEALNADCGNHNSKLISRCRPSGDDKLDTAAWEKTEEELSSEMIFGPFFDFQDVPFPIVHSLRRLVLGNSVQTGSSGTKFGKLCCNGSMAPAETLSSVPGWPYTVFWWKVLPGKFRESSRLVLPRFGYHGWLGYFALCG